MGSSNNKSIVTHYLRRLLDLRISALFSKNLTTGRLLLTAFCLHEVLGHPFVSLPLIVSLVFVLILFD
jgi:hypothetical protein